MQKRDGARFAFVHFAAPSSAEAALAAVHGKPVRCAGLGVARRKLW